MAGGAACFTHRKRPNTNKDEGPLVTRQTSFAWAFAFVFQRGRRPFPYPPSSSQPYRARPATSRVSWLLSCRIHYIRALCGLYSQHFLACPDRHVSRYHPAVGFVLAVLPWRPWHPSRDHCEWWVAERVGCNRGQPGGVLRRVLMRVHVGAPALRWVHMRVHAGASHQLRRLRVLLDLRLHLHLQRPVRP